ncbi:baseplate assembly protein, lysozyme domain [Mycobacterium phage Phrappuccino]|uniref:Baseplate assembly protein, lysozyme domain n=1 Tax=Mycobacterium phage Phrappuccino TaxID=2591223 RepID=A0A514DDS0_9CAUD|nr:baseplate protein [Mycobacterium phage Phrappuccino]QDH91759.1 baseplate assembly protein, lysozyme domain [Mycobacterium phage Phrappuccino]QIQ63201.1 baseplate assembly protein, lysozyme domain [Mycobacterium phage Settecandela]
MSFSLKVSGGDLVQEGSSLAIVSGIEKLKQDLQLWVLEQWGGDRFHPDMGSILQDMIGGVINATTSQRVTAELERVLDNFQRVQKASLLANPQLYSAAELLMSIDDIVVTLSYDTVVAVVKVTSAASQSASLTFTKGL